MNDENNNGTSADPENPLVKVFSLWRDVQLAKRSNPTLAQGAGAVQVPFRQNVNAPQEPLKVVPGNVQPLQAGFAVNNRMLLIGVGLLAAAVLLKKVM